MEGFFSDYGVLGLGVVVAMGVAAIAWADARQQRRESNEERVSRASETAALTTTMNSMTTEFGRLSGEVSAFAAEERESRSRIHSRINAVVRDRTERAASS